MKFSRIGAGGTKVKGKKAAGILFTDGKALLLLKRAGEGDHVGKWSMPGGKGKEGETEIGTATRETREETGLTTIPGFRFNSVSSNNGRQKFTAFLYRVPSPFDVSLSKEHSAYDWVSFDDLSDFDLHPKFKSSLPDYLYLIRRKTTNFQEWASITTVIGLLTEQLP
jgi:8-oxo-dGTP pyrophosphatase MutT (NUDIX family)